MSHRVVILGGGVGGTIVANLLVRKLSKSQVDVTLIDATGQHIYQPGWLYVPFGEEQPGKLMKPVRSLLRRRVNLVVAEATQIDTANRFVTTSDGGVHPFDSLVIASGARLAPEVVPGFAGAAHHFYTADAGVALGNALERFEGGRLVIGVADIPYKCPPAPLEFAFKVEEYLRKRHLRERTEILYLSPINRVFTIESVSTFVTPMLEERGIAYETFFNTESIDQAARKVTSLEGSEVDYDLLVMVPPHRGARVVEQSGLADSQGWLPTERSSLEVKGQSGIYAIGDATDLPVSKSGSAAHFEAKVLADRLTATIKGEEPTAVYDGCVLCFLETGFGKATQLVFDFDHPPQPPAPNSFHHYEKILFNKAYWRLVPRGLV